jgi:hypothetical protein
MASLAHLSNTLEWLFLDRTDVSDDGLKHM